jgi:tetratricopeptide (TPR) repeat protein
MANQEATALLPAGRLLRLKASSGALLVLLLMATGCGPRVVRVPVSPEDFIKANEASSEGDMATARKDYYAALIKYLEAGRLNPNSEAIANKLGIAYSRLKYYPEAAAAFERSIALNPKYAFSYNNLGTVYFATQNLKKAEKLYKKAIGLNPDIASFHLNLGTLHFERKRFEPGMKELRRALALDPNILTKSDAVTLAGNATPSSEKSYFMARIYAAAGDVDHAVESLELAIKTGFTDLQAIYKEPDFNPIREHEKFVAFLKNAEILLKP